MMRRRETTPTGAISTSAQATEVQTSIAAGVPLPDHDLSVLGLGNVVRRFDLDEASNGPSVVFRKTAPFNAFWAGWSATDPDGISAQDTSAATDVNVADPTQALYPITQMATDYSVDVFPILLNLFSSGTGRRYDVSEPETVRYFSMLMHGYVLMTEVIMINKLAYHTDWTKIFPFTDSVPRFLYQIANNLDATDVGLAGRWLPIIKRFDTKVMFPRFVQDIKRMLSPMYSIDWNARLNVPIIANIMTTTADQREADILALLDYVDAKLVDTEALVTSFLPFPMSLSNPWDLPTIPMIDIDRDSAQYNSGVVVVNAFGDTGDPDDWNSLVVQDNINPAQTVYYSRHVQPIWGEIKLATVWRLIPATDNTFYQLTPHYHGNVIIPDDSFDYFVYDGAAVTNASVGFRYIDYANSKYASRDVQYGTQKPGMLGAELTYAPISRLMRVETEYLWSLKILKQVTQELTGASLRELRLAIKTMVAESIKLGV